MYDPGDFWIGFNETGAGLYPVLKTKKELVVLDARPDNVFVRANNYNNVTADNPANASDEYDDGRLPFAYIEADGTTANARWYHAGPVSTLAAGYARIKQLNSDESPANGANLIIAETQELSGDFTITGTSFTQDGTAGPGDTAEKQITFTWKNPAEIRRFIMTTEESDIDKGDVKKTWPEEWCWDSLFDVQSGTLTLEDVTVRGKRESNGALHPLITGSLLTANGGDIVLKGVVLTENENRFDGPHQSYWDPETGESVFYNPEMGCGGAVAVYSGNLTLENDTVISNCGVFRGARYSEYSPTNAYEVPESYGGAIFFTGNGTLTIKSASIEGNTVCAEGERAFGGAICVTGKNPMQDVPEQTSPQLTIGTGVTIKGNRIMRYRDWSGGVGGSVTVGYHLQRAGCGIALLDGANGEITGATITESTGPVDYWIRGGGIYVAASTLNVTGGSITDNVLYGDYAENRGGAIYLEKGSEATLDGVQITGNNALCAGGIYAGGLGASSKVTMTDCILSDNVSRSEGGGALIDSGCELTMSGGTVSGNEAATDGGGLLINGAKLSISNTYIGAENTGAASADADSESVSAAGGNVAGVDGGGISFTGTTGYQSQITGCTFIGNWAGESGGGISVRTGASGEASLKIDENTVVKSNGAQYGGGIASKDYRQGTDRWHQADKDPDDDTAGWVTTRNKDLPTVLENVTVSNNYASQDGGGLYADSKIEITGVNVSISENQAGNDGGGIYTNHTSPSGKAYVDGWALVGQHGGKEKFSIDYQGTQIHLENGSITDNTAENRGGGIYAGDPLKNKELSGAMAEAYEEMYKDIFKNAAEPFIGGPVTVSLKDCTLTGNSAASQEMESSGIYQEDAVRVELAGTLNIGADQAVWLGKSESELMEPYCSDNGYAQDGSDGVSAYTGAYLSVVEPLTVNNGSGAESVNAIDTDFPNYIYKRVIAKYENDLPDPDDTEVAKYKADAVKLDLAGLKVDKELKNVLLLRDERYTPFSFFKYGTAKNAGGDKTPLAGVVFELYSTQSDSPGDYVGADNDNGSWTLRTTVTSDRDGNVDCGGLLPGVYMLVEVQTPLAYEKPSGQWKVTVDEDGNITIEPVAVEGDTPPSFETQTDAEGGTTYSLVNYERPASVFTFTKSDDKSGEAIEGVLFTLDHLICTETSADHDHTEACWEAVTELATGSVVYRSDEDGKVDLGNLITGTYRLTETQTNSGYTLPAAPLIFVFDAGERKIAEQESGDSTFIFTENNGGYILENVKKTNGQDFVFQKTDESGNPLDGAEFLLMSRDSSSGDYYLEYDFYDWYDSTGELSNMAGWYGITQIIKGESRETFISGEDLEPGMVNLGFLEDGEYLLIEKAAPVGYETPVGQWEILVGEEYTGKYFERLGIEKSSELEIIPIAEGFEGEIYPPDFTETNGNYKLVNKSDGTALPFSFTKVRAENTDSPLPGVEFALYQCTNTEEGHTHAEMASDSTADEGCWAPVLENGVAKRYISGEDGRVSLGALKPGDYMLVETKTAKGYRLPTGQWMLTVPDDLSEVKITAKAADGAELPPAFMIEQPEQGTGIIAPEVYKLPNRRETILPILGGKGILYWTLTGGALIALATVLYLSFSRKRNHINAKIIIRREKGEEK